MYNKDNLIHPGPPPLNPKEFNELRANLSVPAANEIDREEFTTKIVNHFIDTDVNTLSGFDAFPCHDIILGCQQYIDNLISKNGLNGLQIFEHDYHYYKSINPNIQYTTVETLESGKPLLIAMPFPGHLQAHREMDAILEKCTEKDIDVHLDCAWLTSAFDITFNFNQPCVKSFAMSFSKAYGLHWNKIGVRWSREVDINDALTVQNKNNVISELNLYVAERYMEKYPIDYICKKYKTEYFEICKQLRLRPSNIIHACFSIDRKFLYGLRNFFR